MSSHPFGNNPDMARALMSELNAQATMKQVQGRHAAALAALQQQQQPSAMMMQSAQHQEAADLLGLRKSMLLEELASSGAGGIPDQIEGLMATSRAAALRNPLYGGVAGLSAADLSLRHAMSTTHPSLLEQQHQQLDSQHRNGLLELLAYERAKSMAAVQQQQRGACDTVGQQAAEMLELQQQAAALERGGSAGSIHVPAISTTMMHDRLAALQHGLAPAAMANKRTQDLLSSLPPSQAAVLLSQIMAGGGTPAAAGLFGGAPSITMPEHTFSAAGEGGTTSKILEEARRLASAESNRRGINGRAHSTGGADADDTPKKKKVAAKPGKKAKEPVKRGRKGKKSYKRKKPQDMPRRPLSAYNLFFSAERERILKEIDAKEKGEAVTSDNDDAGAPLDGNPDALLRPMVLDKPRVHKKMHGKVDFRTLAKMVGERWGKLNDEKRLHYQELARQDSQRHKVAMEQYYKKKHDDRMALLAEEYDAVGN